MTSMRSLGSFSICRAAALLVLLLGAFNARAMDVSPSVTTDGNYTVSWSTSLGCTYNDDPPFYSYYCYWMEGPGGSGSPPGNSFQVTGAPPGTYTYYIYYMMWVYGNPYDEGIVEGPVSVTVWSPPSFTISDPIVNEGDTLSFVVTRNGASPFDHTVHFYTQDYSATAADGDYAPASSYLTFPASAGTADSQTVYIATYDENPSKVESYETVILNLYDAGYLNGATIADSQGFGNILNDDTVSFTINDPPAVAEGTASNNVVGFTVTMNGLTDLVHTIQYSTSNGSATAGSDFTGVGATTLYFWSTQTTQPANITTIADSASEAHETFTVNLSNPGGPSTIADGSGTGTINNDDAPGAAPTNFSGPLGVTGATAALSWTAPSGTVTHYEVERTFDSAATTLNTGSSSTSYNAPLLSSNGLYRFRVRACNSAGNLCGPWSNTREVVRSSSDATTGVPSLSTGSGDAGPSTGLTTDFNGIVSGQASVDASGAATYAIPITIPPGTRGMQPTLALVYSSHAAEGLVGRGWALGGASSSITRCGQTQAQDSTIRSVDYTANDRFCLDGQRLVMVTSGGTYGGDGVKYRTELESFREATSNGGTTSSPNSFTVVTADGRTLSYGGTTGSNFQASAPNATQIAAWLLRRVEDKYGNYYDITYFEDETNGYYRPDRIDYTGHSQTPVSTPYASVEFVYEALPNIVRRFQAGSVSSIRERLKKVVTKNAGTAVREYVLTYNTGEATLPPTSMSRLTSIVECAPTQATGVCTAATSFDWIDEIGGMDSPVTISNPAFGTSQAWADLNGDGRVDNVRLDGTSTQTVALSTGTGFSANQTWTAAAFTANQNFKFADMDGDGDADFIVFGKPGITGQSTHSVRKSTGSGYTSETWTAADTQSGFTFADMNGDGRSDFVTWNNTSATDTITYSLFYSTGTNYSTASWSGPKLDNGTPGWQPTSFDFHDVNSDGRTDLVLLKGTLHRIYVNNGSGFDAYVEVTAGSSTGQWTDINGDGLLDFVEKITSTSHSVSLWNGKNYVNETWAAPSATGSYSWRDVNGDGLADFLGGSAIAFSTGNGYLTPTPAAWAGFSGLGTNAEFLDIDGDGKADYKTALYPFSYQFNRSQPVHLMQKVTDGLGMETVFEFKPLTDSTVHTKLTNAVYPTADIVNAVHVVSRMRQSDGIGGYFDVDYRYTGFKVDKSGRGSLGFASMSAEDIDRKIKSVTTYSQSYPSVGLPTAIDVTVTDKLDNGTNLPQIISGTVRSYTPRNGVTSYGGPPIKYVCVNTDTTVEYDVESGASLRTAFMDNDPTDGGVPCDALGHPGQPGTPDANGTPLSRRITLTDHVPNPDVIYRTDTVTYYNETFVSGLSSLPTRQITKPFVDGVGDATKDRTNAISYVLNKGTVSQVIREPDQAAPIKLTTVFGYDNFGNRSSETITPSETGGTPTPPLARTETVQYDAVGRFPDLLTNAVGHVTDLGFEPKFGTVLTVDGPNATNGAFNDLITRTYDAFGRMKDERRPDGSYQVVYLKTVGASATGIADRPQAKIMVETGVQNTAWGTTPTTRYTPVRTFLDGLGRELRTRSRAFDATNFVHVDTYYDSRGRVQQTSEPYFEGQTPTWNTPAYDVLNRAVGVTAADATESTTTDYDAFTVTTTDAGGRRNRLISDALGRAIRAENLNASGVTLAVTQYLYDKAGNLTTVQKRTAGDALIPNTVITNTFDRLGRRLTTTDPDFGAGANGRVDFIFDSMSDLRQQQTPRLRAQSATLYTEFDYDRLARLTVRRDPSTSLTQTVTSTFTFDEVPVGCEAGKGQLTTEAISGGGEPGLATTYCYSPLQFGRLANEQRTTESVTYRTDLTYDVLGRLSQVRYPATTTWPSASRYAVNYSYTPRGHLERVQEAQGSSTVLFQNVGANERGQIEKAYLGDGSRTTRGFIKNSERLAFTNAAAGTPQVQNFAYLYDAVGNISGRADLLNNVSETFGYDALDRLTGSTVTNGTGPHSVTYAYDDAAGNLGNMTHKSDISTLASASMSYSTSGRPHALTTLNTGSATRTFNYNANGALIDGQVASTTRTLAYTSYDMLASATIGTTSRTFYYGPDRKRYKQVSVAGASTRTYTYIGEHYVKEVEGGATEHKLYIIANGEPVAYVSDDGSPDTRYLHKDHLGSITTIVTNQNVAGSEKLSYDAWGKRRNGTDWWTAPATASEERGYTGHEHLDNVALIHMNGRAYDPELARFTSPDPLVTNPLYSQNYNRYSYVYNNPLKYTDPSGYGVCDIFAICRFVRNLINQPACESCPGPIQSFSGGGYGYIGNDPAGSEAYGFAIAYMLMQQEAEAAAAEAAAEVPADVPPVVPPNTDTAPTDGDGVTPVVPVSPVIPPEVADESFWSQAWTYLTEYNAGIARPGEVLNGLMEYELGQARVARWEGNPIAAGYLMQSAAMLGTGAFNAPSNRLGAGLMVTEVASNFVGLPAIVRGVGPTARSLTAAERVTQLAEQGLTQIQRERFVTLAVTETKEGIRVISSSTEHVQSSVTALLKEGEVAVSGVGHAETTGIAGARALGLTPIGVAASRPICPVCATAIIEDGIEPLTKLK
jgi:RHS repeat-associated protein